ncbi:hypothetical protein GGF43_006453, partial [Coemansia sp. RSA 2618]
MSGLLDISEAVADSPQYRGRLRQFEAYAATLEARISGLGKASKQLQTAAHEYHARTTDVMQRLRELAQQTKDPLVEQTLSDYAGLSREIAHNEQLRTEQLQQIVVGPLLESADTGALQQTRARRREAQELQG